MHAPKPLIYLGPQEVQKPKTLMEMYLGNDYTKLYRDTLNRPDHYSDRQKEIASYLQNNTRIEETPTENELNDLMLQLVRDTEVARKTDETVQRASRDIADYAEGIGQKNVPTYQDQDYGKMIKII